MKLKLEKTSTTKRIRCNYKGPPAYTVQGEKHYDFRMILTVAIGILKPDVSLNEEWDDQG
jgi:hypothetical protein